MSKAFTRESDDAPEEPQFSRPASVLPPGAPNYLTPGGAERLRMELERLTEQERPAVQASSADDVKARLRAVDQRILEIGEALGSARILPPPPKPWDRVSFGASVTVRMADGEEVTYRIVGVDEVDLDRGWVSWLTPVAKALMNARLGERVTLQLPGGRTELEVLGILYPGA